MNPLEEIGFEIPFDRVRAEHVEPAIAALIEEARGRQEAIGSDAKPRTYENTLAAVDLLTERLDRAVTVIRHLESVATYPEMRAAYNAIEPLISEYYSRIPLDEGLWNALKDFASTEEAAQLNGPRKRFLSKTIDSFRRHGASLDAAGKSRLAQIDVELAAVTTRFAQNVLDSTNAFELIVSERGKLAGLPPSAVEAARQSAAAKGVEGWRFTLQGPSYTALMTYLDDSAIREQVYRAYINRATSGEFNNRPLIDRILELRREKARLLAFSDFADFVIEDRMARTGARAQEFLDELRLKTELHFRRENEELLAFRREAEGNQAALLEPWDISYYAEKLRAQLHGADDLPG